MSHRSLQSVSDRRKERGKSEYKYVAEGAMDECLSEAHYSSLSYHEAMLNVEQEINRLDQTMKKCEKIETHADQVLKSSRAIDEKMKCLSKIL